MQIFYNNSGFICIGDARKEKPVGGGRRPESGISKTETGRRRPERFLLPCRDSTKYGMLPPACRHRACPLLHEAAALSRHILGNELHPKSWTKEATKGVQKSMGKELFTEELKIAVVQYVLEGHTRKETSEKFCVSCTPIEKWVNLYKLHGTEGLASRNLVGRQKGFDGEFRLKVLQYKQEHHLSCTQTAMHFCLDVVTVCRWEKKFQKEGARGLMKKQATKGSEKRQKKQEQSELQQENKRLSEENYRLRMENDYLKKLNALIQKREKPE